MSSADRDAFVEARQDDWTAGLVTLYHKFEVLAFAWDAQYERTLDGALDMGVDALFSDYVDRMVDALERFYPRCTEPAEPPRP